MYLTEDSFDEIIRNKFCLVMFEGSWCPVCKQYEPLLKQLKKQHDGSLFLMNIDRNKHVASRFHIRGTPTFILFEGGLERERYVGAVTPDVIRRMVDICR